MKSNVRRYVWDDAAKAMVEILPAPTTAVHEVMPDIEAFRSNDGAVVGSRSKWREHLKRTDTVEMGHSDLASARESWNKRQADHRERLTAGAKFIQNRSGDEINHDAPRETSQLTREILNRLDGRPTPQRKELLKLSLNIARGMRGR